MKNRIIVGLLLFCGALVAVPAQAAPKHAFGKIGQVIAAPVVHPKRTFKEVLGSVVFATESVVDVIHAGTTALSTAASKELKINPFEYVDKGVGYVDTGLEKAEVILFGSSN